MPAPVALNAATAAQLETAFNKHADAMETTSRRIDEVTELLNTVEQNMDSMKANGILARGAGAGGPSAANLFAQSEQFQAFKNGAISTGRVTLETGIAGLRNAATLTSDGGGYGTGTQWSPRLGNAPTRRLQLLDVLPMIEVTAGQFAYNQLQGYTNAAAVQAHQGDAKAQGSVPAELIVANIATIAHYITASAQVLQDSSQLQTQLTTLLSYGVRQKLEDQVLNGVGGTGNIDGLLALATAYASTATSAIDKIGDAATNLASLGWQASAVALNPADWWAMAESKSAGSGEYLLASPGEATVPTLWGMPVAIAPSLAAGTALVLDASQCALLDRQQVVVMASREHANNFAQNLVSVLAECRAGLAVFSPSAVLKVALA